MLRDSQIDRYSRHVILPEIGGVGQERLLASTVAIHGDGDAALLCASHLGGAGVGRLWLDAPIAAPSSAVLAPAGIREALARRNSDCVLLDEPPAEPALVVAIAERRPRPLPDTAVLVWGGSVGGHAAVVRMPAGRACDPCLAALIARERLGETPAVLGTLLALVVLRCLVGLDRADDPWIWRLDGDHPDASVAPFPRRAGCDCGRAAATS